MLGKPLVLFLSIFLVGGLGAQEGEPSWVLYQKGRIAYSEGRWSDAIEKLRAAFRGRPVFPEADWYLGRVYIATGELSTAERHLEAALAEADFLRTPGDAINILYDLDDLLAIRPGRGVLARRVNLLRERVLGSLPGERQNEAGNLQTLGDIERGRYLSAFLEKYIGRPEEKRSALDRVLFLFRKDPDHSQRALTRLAAIWVEGDPERGASPRDAASYALQGLVMVFSRAIQELTRLDIAYQFSVLTPSIYGGQQGIPAALYPERSFWALFQPRAAGRPNVRRLRMHEPLWEYLLEAEVPDLLWTLARALRVWGEEAQRALLGLPDDWERRLGPILGYEGRLEGPWRDILLLVEGQAADARHANEILQHLGQREREVLTILADLFPETPEGSLAGERLAEKMAPSGLVRPSLGR